MRTSLTTWLAAVALAALIGAACSSASADREVAIEIGPEECSPTAIAVTPGESIAFVVSNNAGGDREFEGIEGTRLEEVLVPDGRTRTIDYTVPDAGDATYRLKCYTPGGPSTIIELTAE